MHFTRLQCNAVRVPKHVTNLHSLLPPPSAPLLSSHFLILFSISPEIDAEASLYWICANGMDACNRELGQDTSRDGGGLTIIDVPFKIDWLHVSHYWWIANNLFARSSFNDSASEMRWEETPSPSHIIRSSDRNYNLFCFSSSPAAILLYKWYFNLSPSLPNLYPQQNHHRHLIKQPVQNFLGGKRALLWIMDTAGEFASAASCNFLFPLIYMSKVHSHLQQHEMSFFAKETTQFAFFCCCFSSGSSSSSPVSLFSSPLPRK